MKKTVFAILLLSAIKLHAQLSGIDFSGINAPKNANTSGSALLNGDVLYDFTDKGDFYVNAGGENIKITHSTVCDAKHFDNAVYFKPGSGRNEKVLFSLFSENTTRDGESVYFPLNSDTKCYIEDKAQMQGIKNDMKLFYMKDGFCHRLTYELLDESTATILYNWVLYGGFKYKYDNYLSSLSFETEKNLRLLTSGKVSRVNLKSFNAEAVLFDYIMNPDKEGNITLNILGSDGKKIASYDINRDELSKEESPEKYLSAGIQKLTDKFLKDAATIAKINNQKETMQNTYRNDEERIQQLMYELQYYQKERANR